MIRSQQIQLIDCGKISGSFEEIKDTTIFYDFAIRLGESMRDAGFVYLVNHQPSIEAANELLNKSQEFFTLPKLFKSKYQKVDAFDKFYGYTPAEDEGVAELDFKENGSTFNDLKEAFDFDGGESADEPNYPSVVPGFKNAVYAYRSSLNDLTKKLLRCFAIYLNFDDKDFFINQHKTIGDISTRTYNLVRTNYYFPVPNSIPEEDYSKTIRLGAHCDWGTFTYLVQDEVGGLEAKMPNGEWITVQPIKNSIVLNSGLCLEMWSGGKIPATAHRVRALGKTGSEARQSVAYFIQPDGIAPLAPVVPKKENWVCQYEYIENETFDEYFVNRVRNSRTY